MWPKISNPATYKTKHNRKKEWKNIHQWNPNQGKDESIQAHVHHHITSNIIQGAKDKLEKSRHVNIVLGYIVQYI
jgi:hypothetical protein